MLMDICHMLSKPKRQYRNNLYYKSGTKYNIITTSIIKYKVQYYKSKALLTTITARLQ